VGRSGVVPVDEAPSQKRNKGERVRGGIEGNDWLGCDPYAQEASAHVNGNVGIERCEDGAGGDVDEDEDSREQGCG